MRFATRSSVFFSLTFTLAFAGCVAGEPTPTDVEEASVGVEEEAVAESADALGEETECAHARCETGDASVPPFGAAPLSGAAPAVVPGRPLLERPTANSCCSHLRRGLV